MSNKSVIAGMTEMLFQQAQRLYHASPEDIENEVERSKSLKDLSGEIRGNADTILDYERFRRDYGCAAPMPKALNDGM